MLRKLRYMGLGALIAYFFDPDNGRRRRARARERLSARFQGGAGSSDLTMPEKPEFPSEVTPTADDATLAAKVETEILRGAEVPKGQINVDAENGKVVLRGEVEKPELISDLEQRTRKVQGVREVENLLHTPGAAAPAK